MDRMQKIFGVSCVFGLHSALSEFERHLVALQPLLGTSSTVPILVDWRHPTGIPQALFLRTD